MTNLFLEWSFQAYPSHQKNNLIMEHNKPQPPPQPPSTPNPGTKTLEFPNIPVKPPKK